MDLQEAAMDAPAPQDKIDYRGWVIDIELTGDGEQVSAHANVHRDGEQACLVALTASHADREVVFERVTLKAKELVDGLIAGGKPAAGAAVHQSLESAWH
jgi:hypothetical protein